MILRHYLLLISLLVALLVPLSSHVWNERYKLQAEISPGYVLPSQYSRVLSVGNRGLLADFLFLKAVSFFGGRFIAGQPLGDADWNYVAKSMDVITDLDPYFLDPYFLSEGLLAWDAGMSQVANEILLKGVQHRPEDWRLLFFVGFNHYYFLNDYGTASDYIMRSAKLPGSPGFLQTLASRLAYYGGKSKTALLFLQQMIAEANDPLLKNRLAKRLLTLERAVAIEEALEKFKQREGHSPGQLRLVVEHGYLNALPDDPYGGEWYVLENGRVFSSSKFVEKREDGAN